MVLEIRLSNFFSIKDEIVLDLRAGNSKSAQMQLLQDNTFAYKDEQVLKSVAIYGANASGKSNIIKAIEGSVKMITESHLYNENTRFSDLKYFKFDSYVVKPSTFFIRFVLDGIEYEYDFSIRRILENTFTDKIISENLYYYPNGRKTKIFTRDENKGTEKKDIYSFGSAVRKPFDVAENTSQKTLYISRASQMDREIAKKIFLFFFDSMQFGYDFTSNSVDLDTLFFINKNEILNALKIADSDIVDIKMSKDSENYFKNRENINSEKQLKTLFETIHKENRYTTFDLYKEESEGTQKLFFMVLMILEVIKKNKIMFIDEIENSLHPKIVEYIINLFHASSGAQLVFTTHNTNLLNMNLMRKDQIYFCNKKDDGSTDLYSLFDYKDFRDTMDAEKAYLQGRFDAIPYINDSKENLKSLSNE